MLSNWYRKGRRGQVWEIASQQPSLSVSCWAVRRLTCLILICNDIIDKPEVLDYVQSEHPEPEITVGLGLHEGGRYFFRTEGWSLVKFCLVHVNPAQALYGQNCWQGMLLWYIKWHKWLPANLFGCCSYLKMKLNLRASLPKWKFYICLRVSFWKKHNKTQTTQTTPLQWCYCCKASQSLQRWSRSWKLPLPRTEELLLPCRHCKGLLLE